MSRYDRDKRKNANKTAFILVIVTSLLIGVCGTYIIIHNFLNLKDKDALIANNETQNAPAVLAKPSETQQVVAKEAPNVTALESMPPVETAVTPTPNQMNGLPDLLSSDPIVQQAVTKLSPALAQWLVADQLIRRYLLIVNDFAQGIRITKHMSFIRNDEPFSVEQDENGLYIAPKSYRRYNGLAQAVQAIKTKPALAIYIKIRPLMLQVFSEFSYPKDITLESIVQKAVGEILSAPVMEGRVGLVRPSVYYKFADPKEEASSPVHRQMLRMGPENTRIIQNKCRELLVELGKTDFK